ncbi:MAG: hypothetical protein RR607_06135 [Akkermansia sp.]
MNEDVKKELIRIYKLFHECFDTDAGEEVLKELRVRCRLSVPCFMSLDGTGAVDPCMAAYRNGRQSVLMEIEEILNSPTIENNDTKPKQLRSPRR